VFLSRHALLIKVLHIQAVDFALHLRLTITQTSLVGQSFVLGKLAPGSPLTGAVLRYIWRQRDLMNGEEWVGLQHFPQRIRTFGVHGRSVAVHLHAQSSTAGKTG
jgi:hypothetical protein